jgi:hypothetical protein
MKSTTRLAALAVISGTVATVSAVQPPNDNCGTATPAGNGRFAFTTVGATNDYTASCDGDPGIGDVWFDYLAPTTGFAKIRPDTDAPADLGVTVLDGGCGGAELACAGDLVWVGDTRQVVFPTVAGQHYLVRFYGTHLDEVSGHVLFSTATPPANDECFTATVIGGPGSFSFDNTLANNSGPDDAVLCDGFGGSGIAHDVWFRWTSTLPAGQDAVISLCGGTRVDTKIAVYHDGCPVGAPLDCNDDFCFLQSRATFRPAPGATYLIRIGNWPGMENEPAPDGKPGTFTIVAQPTCHVPQPGSGVVVENEPCGQSLNDGWDEDCTNGGHFTNLTLGPSGAVTVFGTAAVLGDIPDQDMYRVTLAQASHVVFSGTSEFPMMLGVLDTVCPPSLYQRLRVPQQPCQDPMDNPLEIDLDPGTYAFAVSNARNASDCSAANNYTITISVAPCVGVSITTQPHPQASCTGSAAVFTVAVTGSSPFINWLRDGEPVFDDDHISGSFSSELTISNPTQADLGVYTANVSNACSATSSDGAALTLVSRCGPADLGGTGGVAAACGDGVLDNNDFVVFIDYFFSGSHYADVGSAGGVAGSDGQFNNNDFVVFIDQFFSGCN